ncbi:quorum-sensing phosphorelay protein LuxU [Vibrio zhugei]|uniref:Phosphorelay protein LuxU n=1 Tax=Vibrio zhugei TaxID=2479546 RepID=A0ABV7C987_9VIBR|nr:quorum-sensing phosphorelay protein LuxU [Vibrio zhugei]
MDLLNKNKIDTLASEIGQENVPVLLGIFLSELTTYENNLREHAQADSEYLKEISHALKSSAASFGADKLCAKAIEIDGMVKLGLEMDVMSEYEHLIQLLRETRERYERLQPSSGA